VRFFCRFLGVFDGALYESSLLTNLVIFIGLGRDSVPSAVFARLGAGDCYRSRSEVSTMNTLMASRTATTPALKGLRYLISARIGSRKGFRHSLEIEHKKERFADSEIIEARARIDGRRSDSLPRALSVLVWRSRSRCPRPRTEPAAGDGCAHR
jgi:hypothetical protein